MLLLVGQVVVVGYYMSVVLRRWLVWHRAVMVVCQVVVVGRVAMVLWHWLVRHRVVVVVGQVALVVSVVWQRWLVWNCRLCLPDG